MGEYPTVAFDVDSTLARTCDVAFKLLGVENKYSYDDISSWKWGLETFGKAAYLNALWHAWTIRGYEIEPFSEYVEDQTKSLKACTESLDIVTAHPENALGITDAKVRWMKRHRISYDEMRVKSDKHLLDYDIIVDDNPNLPENAATVDNTPEVLLYNQPYNRNAAGEYTRIASLDGALEYINSY